MASSDLLSVSLALLAAAIGAAILLTVLRSILKDEAYVSSISRVFRIITRDTFSGIFSVLLGRLIATRADNSLPSVVMYQTDQIDNLVNRVNQIEKSGLAASYDNILFHSRVRLIGENNRLARSAWKNLLFGIFFSLVAIVVLFVSVFPLFNLQVDPLLSSQFDFMVFLSRYLPRLSVSILVQLIGFFFLRLYVSNENDIKHNKNEITNVEMKMAAQSIATQSSKATLGKIAEHFANTERNFILKVGERSIAAENLAEYNELKSLIEAAIHRLEGK